MATFKSRQQKALDAHRQGSKPRQTPAALHVQGTRRLARFEVDMSGTEADGDVIELGSLNVKGARILPETSRIRFGGSGNGNAGVTLQRRNAAGTVLESLGAATANQAATAAPTFAGTKTDTIPTAASDYLTLLVGTVTTAFATTRVLIVEVDYFVQSA